ncbi:NADH-quinone oxidoreductase subunit NuoG [soil metagenome]
MPKAKVNGVEVEFTAGMTALQVAELAGEEIPRFCYHERLSIAGNCRMCLVEVKPGPPKPQASCALPAADGQEIFTNTPMVKKAREGVMEFLLINHPLDCPICDQGGECDLQDQALGYGRDGTRYLENKRAVEEKAMGPLIKTVMTRFIQCTRCVRFATEAAGVPELGMISRGEDAEITPYLENAVTSELSGNLVDVCPVGALTSRPYAFNARPWELKKTETIDVMDALGCAIRLDAKGPEVMRALPRVNEDINEEWLADKSRHHVDGLMRQRLDRPYVRIDGRLRPASWGQALTAVAHKLKATAPDRIGVIAGDLQDAESMKAALDLFTAMGVTSVDCRQDGVALDPKWGRESYLFNSTIAALDEADYVLLIGTDVRKEAPILNARIRKRWLRGGCEISVIGQASELTYPYTHLGEGASALAQFRPPETPPEKPLVIVGQGALTGTSGAGVLALAAKAAQVLGAVKDGWNGFNVLHTAAARVGGLDLGFTPKAEGKTALEMAAAGGVDVLFLMGADEIDLAASSAFTIYMGSHGDVGAMAADVILPAAAYAEKPGLYVNTEGRVQLANRAVFPKGEAKEDWAILRALSAEVGHTLPYDTLADLRAKLMADHSTFGAIDYVAGHASAAKLDLSKVGEAGAVSDAPFQSPVRDYYLTNPIARSSVVMAECSAQRVGRPQLLAAE